jgi:hypothetical protein
VQTTYSATAHELDQPIRDADAERKAGESIRIRLQPTILQRVSGQHRMWPRVSWIVDCDSVEEVVALREGLKAFFEASSRVGPGTLATALAQLGTHTAEAPVT